MQDELGFKSLSSTPGFVARSKVHDGGLLIYSPNFERYRSEFVTNDHEIPITGYVYRCKYSRYSYVYHKKHILIFDDDHKWQAIDASIMRRSPLLNVNQWLHHEKQQVPNWLLNEDPVIDRSKLPSSLKNISNLTDEADAFSTLLNENLRSIIDFRERISQNTELLKWIYKHLIKVHSSINSPTRKRKTIVAISDWLFWGHAHRTFQEFVDAFVSPRRKDRLW